jgi:D-psicose/D-tagatose/L-ribulose 3-epimerase
MARFGAHAFVWESTWDAEAARRAIRSAAEAGLDFIEIPLLRPAELDVEHTVALLREFGIGATCSLGLPAEASFGDRPQAAETFLLRAVDVVARIGSPVLTGVIYGSLGVLPGRPPTDEERERVAVGLARVARHARGLGLGLGIEPVNRYETHLVNLASQGLELIDAIAEENVFLHLDTYHMNVEEQGFAAPIRAAGARLRYIHLSESDRGVPGTGNVRWDDVFQALAEIGYRDDLVLESFVAVNPDIARATCMWRPVVSDSDALIRDGRSFLEAKAVEYGLLGRA